MGGGRVFGQWWAVVDPFQVVFGGCGAFLCVVLANGGSVLGGGEWWCFFWVVVVGDIF